MNDDCGMPGLFRLALLAIGLIAIGAAGVVIWGLSGEWGRA